MCVCVCLSVCVAKSINWVWNSLSGFIPAWAAAAAAAISTPIVVCGPDYLTVQSETHEWQDGRKMKWRIATPTHSTRQGVSEFFIYGKC